MAAPLPQCAEGCLCCLTNEFGRNTPTLRLMMGVVPGDDKCERVLLASAFLLVRDEVAVGITDDEPPCAPVRMLRREESQAFSRQLRVPGVKVVDAEMNCGLVSVDAVRL
jgi:hypothetical protein